MGRETSTVQDSPAIIRSDEDLLLCDCSVVVQVTIFGYFRIASSLTKGSFARICPLPPLLECFHCHTFACVGVLDLSNIGHYSDRECQCQGRINAMNCLVGDHLDHGILHWHHTSFQQRTFVPFVSLFAKQGRKNFGKLFASPILSCSTLLFPSPVTVAMRKGFFPQILYSRSIDLRKRGSFLGRIGECRPDFLEHPQFGNVMLFRQRIKVEIDLESREKFCSLVLAKPFIGLLHETNEWEIGVFFCEFVLESQDLFYNQGGNDSCRTKVNLVVSERRPNIPSMLLQKLEGIQKCTKCRFRCLCCFVRCGFCSELGLLLWAGFFWSGVSDV